MAGRTPRLSVFVCLVLAVFCAGRWGGLSVAEDEGVSTAFPRVMDTWSSREVESDRQMLREALGAGHLVFRSYMRKNYSVTLYLAWYQDMQAADKVHDPAVCYPAQGWRVDRQDQQTLVWQDKQHPVRRMFLSRSSERQMVYTWWQQGEQVFADTVDHRFAQVRRVFTGQTGASIWVRVSMAMSSDDEDELLLREFSVLAMEHVAALWDQG